MIIIDVLIYGAAFGAILMLLSVGYSLVYGVGGIINLAHGSFYMLTGYFVFWFVESGVGYSTAIVLGIVLIAVVAAISYLIFIKHFQDHEVGCLIVTFAIGYLIEHIILIVEGASAGQIEDVYLDRLVSGRTDILGTTINNQYILIMIVAAVLMFSLIMFIKYSKFGKSIRAVSQDKEAAQLMGINVNGILMFTIVLSAVLAGIAAILFVPENGLLPTYGWDFLLTAISVVALGGLGSLSGSVLGSFVIAYARYFTFYYIDLPYSLSYSGIIHLIVIVVMLIFRPQGIMGKKERT